MNMKKMNCFLSLLALLVSPLSSCKKDNIFAPRLSTDTKLTLNTIGFFGNFEALDEVTNSFNDYYPNIEFEYHQVGGDNIISYMDTNSNVDIMMTSLDLVSQPAFLEKCVDLSKIDLNLDDIEEKMVSSSYYGDKLHSIPIGKNVYGLVVNVSLLKKYSLEVPTKLSEFKNCLSVLKEKGYTPIQGPSSKVYSELTYNMFFDTILDDDSLYQDLIDGKESAKEKLSPVFDFLQEMIDEGYIDEEVDSSYPNDNYDKAILKFFEGEVPFWVCNSEKVSGMKKKRKQIDCLFLQPV